MATSDLFNSGDGGYHTYRIPALVVTTAGTILAFCEGRRESSGDAGHIDLLVRRSDDGGKTWGDPLLVAEDPPHTVGNPSPVVDRATGRIHLLFCKNLGDGGETLICEGKAPRTVWSTTSDDDGLTWSTPREITAQVKRDNWTWYATGPCHGIQLASGRIVVPCDHIRGVDFNRQTDPYHSHLIYSDDGGASWQIGAITPEDTNESTVAETGDGAIYINCRNQSGMGRRGNVDAHRFVGWSRDQGVTFGETRKDPALPDPICQGSVISLGKRADLPTRRLVFVNPVGPGRTHLTLRISDDGGRTWPMSRVLAPGPSAYADLCELPDGRVGVFYECGDEGPYERLRWQTVEL